MRKNDFWVISLIALTVISAVVGLNLPLRIALTANAVIVLIDVINRIRRIKNGRSKEEN